MLSPIAELLELLLRVLQMLGLVVVLHELSHIVLGVRRIRGIIIGYPRARGGTLRRCLSVLFLGLGFITYPPRKASLIMPQLIVPLILILFYHSNVLLLLLGIVFNMIGGILDIFKLKKVDEEAKKPWDMVKEEYLNNFKGFILWIRP